MTTPSQLPARPVSLDSIAGKMVDLERLIRMLPLEIEHLVRSNSGVPHGSESEASATSVPVVSSADSDIESARSALADIEKEVAEARQELDEVVQQIGAHESQLALAKVAYGEAMNASAALQNEITAAREQLCNLETQITEAQSALVEIQQQQKAAEQLIAQADIARREIESAEQTRLELHQKEAGLRALEEEYSGYRDSHAAAQSLLARIWPEWMATEAFAPWRTQLESGILAPDAPASTTLLFAALHGYNAALRESGDPRFLLDSLRELSRRLLAWLKEVGRNSEAEAAAEAQIWAAEVNRECSGKAEVEVPLPGNPADTSWMIFPPRTGSTEIVAVHTWCVRDGQKRPINKAQVAV